MSAAPADPSPAANPADAYDGVGAGALAAAVGVPRLDVYRVVGSTMDVAHVLADAGAPDGSVVLADEQVAGRGRQGRGWGSGAGRGVWLTMIERPRDLAAVEVLSLRIGLAVAEALQDVAPSTVRLKWPNDLMLDGRKLAGVLVEARWRETRPEWVAIGIGVNVRPPFGYEAASLPPDVSRVDVLARIVPALRAAVRAGGRLTDDELARYARRDGAAGRRVSAPAPGVVAGIDATGAVLIAGADGVHPYRTGSLVFSEEGGRT